MTSERERREGGREEEGESGTEEGPATGDARNDGTKPRMIAVRSRSGISFASTKCQNERRRGSFPFFMFFFFNFSLPQTRTVPITPPF